jgi:hypothetical protein
MNLEKNLKPSDFSSLTFSVDPKYFLDLFIMLMKNLMVIRLFLDHIVKFLFRLKILNSDQNPKCTNFCL